MIFTQLKASQVSNNAHSWTVGNDSLSGTFYTFCRPCKSPERTGDVAEWKNTCLACTRLWVQSPTLHKRTPKCQDDEPPFTGEMRKLSLREVTLSAEFQGKEGTEPGWVRRASLRAGWVELRAASSSSRPFPAHLERSTVWLGLLRARVCPQACVFM